MVELSVISDIMDGVSVCSFIVNFVFFVFSRFTSWSRISIDSVSWSFNVIFSNGVWPGPESIEINLKLENSPEAVPSSPYFLGNETHIFF